MMIPTQIRIIRLMLPCLVAIGAFLGASPVTTQTALVLENKIPLGDIRGRLDHMAVDLGRQRLFVAELENNSVAVVDFHTREIAHVITDVRRPQGLAYVPSADTLFVANGSDGSLRMFQGEQYRPTAPIHLGDDADNVRFDPETNHVYVSYGEGALGIIDVASRRKIDDVALTAHPESFQLDRESNRIYVNSPKEQTLIVLDRISGKRIATWQTGNGSISRSPSIMPRARSSWSFAILPDLSYSPHRTAPLLQAWRPAGTPMICSSMPSAGASMSAAEKASSMCSTPTDINSLSGSQRSKARERPSLYLKSIAFLQRHAQRRRQRPPSGCFGQDHNLHPTQGLLKFLGRPEN